MTLHRKGEVFLWILKTIVDLGNKKNREQKESIELTSSKYIYLKVGNMIIFLFFVIIV